MVQWGQEWHPWRAAAGTGTASFMQRWGHWVQNRRKTLLAERCRAAGRRARSGGGHTAVRRSSRGAAVNALCAQRSKLFEHAGAVDKRVEAGLGARLAQLALLSIVLSAKLAAVHLAGRRGLGAGARALGIRLAQVARQAGAAGGRARQASLGALRAVSGGRGTVSGVGRGVSRAPCQCAATARATPAGSSWLAAGGQVGGCAPFPITACMLASPLAHGTLCRPPCGLTAAQVLLVASKA